MHKRIDPTKYDTDKNQLTHYLGIYEEAFAPYVDKNIRLLELGVHKGGSLYMWRDYFDKGQITGLDINSVEINDVSGRIHFYRGSQSDTAFLDRIASEQAPDGFEVIIDDCSHIGELTRISFWHLFKKHLKPGGVYAIEDWGTGYWPKWPDGMAYKPKKEAAYKRLRLISRLLGRNANLAYIWKKRYPSHDFGMVGVIKELVDEIGADDETDAVWGTGPNRTSSMDRVLFTKGLVIVRKATNSV